MEIFVSVVLPVEKWDAGLVSYLRALDVLLEKSYTDWEVLILVPPPGLSSEQTRSLLDTPYVRLLTLSTLRRTVQNIAGLEHAIGDYVVIADDRYDPADQIPAMVRACREHQGAVFGLDTDAPERGALHRFARSLFFRYAQRYLHPDFARWQEQFGNTDFQCLSRAVVNDLIKYKDPNPYLKLAFVLGGHAQSLYRYQGLNSGTRYRAPFLHDVARAVEITISNTRHPLRLVTQLGFLAATFNVLYIFYIIGVYFIKKKPAEGWTTLSLQQSCMFFAISVILVVMCEYIGRILEESQRRPNYHLLREDCAEQIVNRQRRNTTPDEQ